MTYLLVTVLFIISIVLVIRFRMKAVIIVVLSGFLQNFILPLLLTTHLVNAGAVTAGLYFKDILCGLLALYAIRSIYISGRGIRLSVLVLAAFTFWCVFRGVIGIELGDPIFLAGRWLRDICGPIEFTIIGIALAREEFARPSLYRYVALIALIAAIALPLASPWGETIWGKYINIASFNVLVKHEAADTQDEEQGVSGTGNLAGRSAFGNVVSFRAMGTFGDPLSMSINMAFALALGLIVFKKKNWLFLIFIILALFFGFSRSSWIFFTVIMLFVMFRQKRIWMASGFFIVLMLAITFISPLRDFLSSTLEGFTANSDDAHAAGVKALYSSIWDRPNILAGNGFNTPNLPESGYGNFILIFGVPSVILFLGFCFAAFLDLRRPSKLNILMQGVILATTIVMNFSYYPFAFNAYIVIWLAFGAAISGYDPERLALPRRVVRPAQYSFPGTAGEATEVSI